MSVLTGNMKYFPWPQVDFSLWDPISNGKEFPTVMTVLSHPLGVRQLPTALTCLQGDVIRFCRLRAQT